jgi:hypothetical protein
MKPIRNFILRQKPWILITFAIIIFTIPGTIAYIFKIEWLQYFAIVLDIVLIVAMWIDLMIN